MNDINKLNIYLKEFNIELDDYKLSQFQKYFDILIEWNEKINLTAITEFEDVLIKHFVDSISIIKAGEIDLVNKLLSGDKISVIDIGTGAGFPSIPLKIVFPNANITMLDSLNKRIKFLNIVIDELGLQDITALHGRAEDYASPDKLREKFDICVSRAVANLSTLSEYCLPYVKQNGVFISYKSETIKEEMVNAKNAIYVLGGSIKNIFEFNLPSTDFYRALCVINKDKVTPKKFPRKAGLPSKEPL